MAAVLCGVALVAHAQTAPQQPVPAPSQAIPATPPNAIGMNGKPVVAPPQVLADPATRIYSVCLTDDEHEATDSNTPAYVRPPKSQLMSEDAAKAKGYKAGAHKVSCK